MANCLEYHADKDQQAKIQLLWIKSRQPISRLCINVLREVCSFLFHRSQVIALCGREVAVFDIDKRSFQFASLSMTIPDSCVFSELTPQSILILGFDNKSVYSLEFPSLAFAPLAEMNHERGYPGIIRYKAFVYVFGSYFTSRRVLASSERYNVAAGAWETLPNMHCAKGRFCPVLHKQRIYTAVFLGESLLEWFDPETLAFTTHCNGPDSSYMFVAAAVGDEMLILTWERAYQVVIEEEKVKEKEAHRLGFAAGSVQTRSTPLVVGREVWLIRTVGFTAVGYNIDEHQIYKLLR